MKTAHPLAASTAALIDLLAQSTCVRPWEAVEAVEAGMPVESAIEAAQAGFAADFAAKLTAAFSELLRRSSGTAEVRTRPKWRLSSWPTRPSMP